MAVQYTDLVNKSGTIYNAKTGSGYANPDQLAADLGVNSSAINWGSIKADPNWSFSAPASPAPAPAQTFSFMDNKTYDINQKEVTNSSSQVDSAVKNLGNDIQKSSSKTPDITSLLESFKVNDENSAKKSEELGKLYADRMKLLDERRQAEMERINAEYGTETAKKEADYQEAIKPFQERLQRLKDTPYGPNATLEEDLKLKLAGLEKTHKLEMDTLFNRRQSSIALAQSAYEDKDFALSEAMIKNAKDSEQEMYNRSQDYYNMVLNAQEEERARQKAEYENTKSVFDFNMKYGINQPFYTIAGTVFNSQTLQPEYENVNGTMVRVSDGKRYASSEEFFKDTGISSFNQIQSISAEQAAEQDLVADMQKKYIDAGIRLTDTYDQAMEKLKNSKIYKQQTRLSDGNGDGDGSVPTDAKVRKLLYQIKNENPGIPWYELWDMAAKFVESNNINPTNYDKIFWEVYHPGGVRAWEEEYKNSGNLD